ncbi:MAG TPA: class I SAM-dependent methyltransferase [Chitinophagales bacterium]|nr:class I SAM-dependent methyltransferase [Chitinophagales bacterium]HMW11863.1 class I SAM-dependent methyltransferase [Chitinophagales bacterium]HMX59008.1 class I SAM-dependent methyltransferase [Chitinophagales bacterium]HMY22357.1 class I SAM-dependent methyltransferase [Chitinophagales bacterium]HMZ32939.1 class I SAM-dependent methyltransferase [Chitinophagales bacterium]
MGAVSFSIPKKLVTSLVNDYKIKNFVETGTFRGDSSIWAADYFEKVYTIEINEEIFTSTSNRPDRKPNIEFLQGNSKDRIPEIIEKINDKSLFWLDGHWCVGAGGKEHECPLEDELLAISKIGDNAVVLIDDARCFLGKLPPPHKSEDWPTISEIFKLFFQHFPNHNVTIIQDVIVAVPKQMQKTIDTYWMQNYADFYSDAATINKYSLYKIIKLKILHLLRKFK